MNGTKDNYTSMTQIVVNSSQTVTLELMKDTAYTIIVSKPYIYTLSFSGGGAINNNSYTFMTANADTTTTQTVVISGATSGSGFNNSIII